MKRRDFLKTSAAATFGFQFIPRHVLGQAGATPPSRKINLAAIGCGGQAGSDLNNMMDENIVALCDVDERRAAGHFQKSPNAKRYKDFRIMLDEMGDQIDAVLVGTPDHTHAVAAMAAMARGKHVFCEKPLAHSVGELRAMRQMAADKKVITQMGNQGHSSETIRLFKEFVLDGAIGDVTEVHCGCNAFPDVYCQINKADAIRAKQEVPKELDWDLWQGPAERRDFNAGYLPFNWRGWSNYGSGCIGDWVCHVVDPTFWALDLDMPVSIQAETDGAYNPEKHFDLYPAGSKITYEFAAKGKRGPVKLIWYDGKFKIPKPAELEADRNVVGTGAVVRGTRGAIMHGSHGAGEVRLIPETAMKAYKRPDKTLPRVVGGHYRSWLNAIRDNQQASSPFEYGARLSEVGLLGMAAIRMTGTKLLYDEKSMTFTNSPEATKLLNPPLHNGYKLG